TVGMTTALMTRMGEHSIMARRIAGRLSRALLLGTLAACVVTHSDARDISRGSKLSDDAVVSTGSISIGGQRVDYQAVAGSVIVHAKGWDAKSVGTSAPQLVEACGNADQPATASMFYVAYFRRNGGATERPLTFIYGGGPGSSTYLQHMAMFGPKRVVIQDTTHTAAPYRLVDNPYSLLDVSDVIFIDAPGTGFSRTWGKDHEKAFYGVDADARAFAEFIQEFLSRSGR